MIVSYLDLPAFALPTGTDGEGQHTSMQITLPTGEDDRLIPVALAVGRALSTDEEENKNG
jgi:aspartyl-tRNA(Asn)/glutamyl-tRNA(Gln) amidotransferase subunit A